MAGFLIAGPVLGLALGFVAAGAIVVTAARARPGDAIEPEAASDSRRRVLIALTHELDDPAAVERLKRETGLTGDSQDVLILVLAPAVTSALERWASDVGPARAEAQRKLVVSVASLGKADVPATATVGDDDIVQAVDDALQSFAATEVVLVTGPPDSDPGGERAASELERRLRLPLSRIVMARTPAAGGL